MVELLKAGIVFCALFFIMFSLGNYVLLIGRKEKHSVGCMVIYGFILYFFLFEFIAFPLMITKQPLNRLTAIWSFATVVLVLVSCLKFAGYWRQRWKERKQRGYSLSFYLMLMLIGLQCLFVALWSDNSADAAYYVANVSANIATNTINIYEPFTGVMQEEFYVRYLFGLYPVHNSVVCQLTGISPLVLTKTVMSVFTVILSYLVYIQIGMKLFQNQREKVWKMVCFLSLIQFFFYTMYSNASFLLTRGYEGKAILANVILPFVLYLGICLFENIGKKEIWLMLFCTGIAGADISMSGMSIIPVAVSAVCLSGIIYHRAWSRLKSYVLCILPSIGIILVYLLASRGYITLWI